MLIHTPTSRPTLFYQRKISSAVKSHKSKTIINNRSTAPLVKANSRCSLLPITIFLASCTVAVASATGAIEAADPKTLSNVPQSLSSECASSSSSDKDCKRARIQKPKSRKAESCTVKCVNTCIRGGEGSPGEGPLNIRRPLVVFKQGFRSRQYCLVECSDICNLIGDGDDGP